jgi:hypothetical protein
MAGIFTSYRRDDAAPYAGHLRADLARRFGDDRVFMDITALEPGVSFSVALDRAVATCDVLLAVIGPRWLTVTDESGGDVWTTRPTSCAGRSRRRWYATTSG